MARSASRSWVMSRITPSSRAGRPLSSRQGHAPVSDEGIGAVSATHAVLVDEDAGLQGPMPRGSGAFSPDRRGAGVRPSPRRSEEHPALRRVRLRAGPRNRSCHARCPSRSMRRRWCRSAFAVVDIFASAIRTAVCVTIIVPGGPQFRGLVPFVLSFTSHPLCHHVSCRPS